MRRIDNWVGKPAALALGLVTRAPRSLYGDWRLSRPPRRVICAKFIGLGSVVLSFPLLKQLKEKGVRVAFWSFPAQAELVRTTGLADEVWVIDPSPLRFLPTLARTLAKAWAFRADAFLDLEPTANFTALLARVTQRRMRIGFMCAKPVRERLFTHLVALNSERHLIEHTLRMGELIGLGATGVETVAALPPLPALRDRMLNPFGGARKPVILNVNSSDLSWHRMWPAERWAELAARLLEDPDVSLFFVGVASERQRVDDVLRRLPTGSRARNLAGQTTLSQMIGLLSEARLVVSVDSGIMHLAAWANAPLVALFGPEAPGLYGPRSPLAEVVWAGLPCSPCLSAAADKITRCRDNQCMKLIPVDRVFAACRAQLEWVETRSRHRSR